MIKIGLDMAQNNCGYAIHSGKNLKFDSLVLTAKEKKELTKIDRIKRMTDWVFTKISPALHHKHQIILEGIYLGVNAKSCMWGCYTQGAFIYQYARLTGRTDISMPLAITARKDIEDLRTRASKAEIQIYVIDRFGLADIDKSIRKEANQILAEYQAKGMSSSTFNARMGKLSTRIKQETGIDEHMADAIVLTI